ncbi:alpha/beta fold hydrolase [Streptoverticillium reticulum]|uniref:alpha/beta fold hydrolase n=1 Tax=Streptoverticillium reticulum TaxID=1433415 RepID=UPI0039BFFDBC
MTTRTALLEEVIPLTLHGYAYSGRIVHRPDARVAPIVLVGGAFQHQNGWGRVERAFLEAASVITVDLPGWGSADRLPARYGFDFLAEALDQLLSKVAPGPVNVLGTSYGSAVAHQWACEHPGRAERVALVGTMAHLTDHARARVSHLLRLAEHGSRTEFVNSVLHTMVCFSPRATVLRRPTVVRCLTRALNELTADDVAKYRDNTLRLLMHAELPRGYAVRAPVLVATGEHDPLTTPALSREAATRCPDARFTTLKDADHLVHLERPTEIVDLLIRFFSGESLAGLDYCHPVEYLRQQSGGTLPSPRPSHGS